MRSKLAGFLLILSLMALVLPASASAQDREGYGGYVRRDKNGVRIGDDRIVLFDGPGVLNYHRKHRWMSGAGGAATVIGVGAGAGAATGAIVKGKKGAVIGAAIGAGAATGIWLYKNRTEKRRIF